MTPPKKWDKMPSCPTNYHRFRASSVNSCMTPPKKWDKMPSCPTNYHRFRASSVNSCMTTPTNVGQDAILSHELSSFQGEFCELVYDSSEKRGTRCHLVPRIIIVSGRVLLTRV